MYTSLWDMRKRLKYICWLYTIKTESSHLKVLSPTAQMQHSRYCQGRAVLAAHTLPVGSTLLTSSIHFSTLCSSFILSLLSLFIFGLTLLIKCLITFIKSTLKDSSVRCQDKVSHCDKLKVFNRTEISWSFPVVLFLNGFACSRKPQPPYNYLN